MIDLILIVFIGLVAAAAWYLGFKAGATHKTIENWKANLKSRAASKLDSKEPKEPL